MLTKIIILIVSKKVLVAAFIFVESSHVEPNMDCPLSEIYQSCVSKSYNDESSIEEQEKLKNSILARTPESDIDEMSINKFLQRLEKIINPVISNQNLWRVLSELEKPLKSQLSDRNSISSTDILATTPNLENKQPNQKID